MAPAPVRPLGAPASTQAPAKPADGPASTPAPSPAASPQPAPGPAGGAFVPGPLPSPSASPSAPAGAPVQGPAGASASSPSAKPLNAAEAALAAQPSPTSTPPAQPAVPPTPVPGAPAAPGSPSGVFSVLTRSGQAAAPVMRLRWGAAEAGEFLIKGYRLLRSEAGSGAWFLRPPSAAPALLGLGADDPVSIGTTYDYVVEAVDVRNHAGPRSAAFHVDLRNLPDEQVAPRPPEGLQAQSRRDTVLLTWRPSAAWVDAVAKYRVFRGDSWEEVLGAAQPVTEVGAAGYMDSPTAKAKDYVYALRAVDLHGRVSALGASITARASGPLPPGSPVGLTTRAKVEKVTLSWSPAQPGTSPVSAYWLRRREEGSEDWKNVAYLNASASTHTDSVAGDRAYLYSLAAVDAEGLTGAAATIGASPTAKVWNKTLVILMPTAYANNRGYDRGLNLNVLFDFYVGSLYENYNSPVTGFTKTGLLQPLQIGTVTTDFKWSLLDDRGLIPGLAAGLYSAALIPFGSPGGGQNVGVSSAGSGISTLGNVYGVVSKRFWPGEPRAALHLGIMYGKLADYLTSDPTPKDWRPTLRHLTPGGDVPLLLNRFVDPKLGVLVAQAPHMAFAGLQLPFTLPLLFGSWRTGIRVEGMLPLPESADYAINTTNTLGMRPEELLPFMTNIHVDNLPLFGFEFSLFQYRGGYQVIAFYHVPDLTWSW